MGESAGEMMQQINWNTASAWIKTGHWWVPPERFHLYWCATLLILSVSFCHEQPRSFGWTVVLLLPVLFSIALLQYIRCRISPGPLRALLGHGSVNFWTCISCFVYAYRDICRVFAISGVAIKVLLVATFIFIFAALYAGRLWLLCRKNAIDEDKLALYRDCALIVVGVIVWVVYYEVFLVAVVSRNAFTKLQITVSGALFTQCWVSMVQSLFLLKAFLLYRHPDKTQLLEYLAQNIAVKARHRYAAYKMVKKNKRSKKRWYLLLAWLLFMVIFLCFYGVDGLRKELFCHDEREHIARIEIVFAENVAPDDTVEYTVTQTVDNETGCIRRLRLLPRDKNMLTPKAVRRVRGQAYMFKITYNDGCWELVDAAGRFVVPSPDCGPINGQPYWHDGGPVAFQQAAFDALVQTFLEEPVSP